MLWEFSIVSSLSWYSILVQYTCAMNALGWLPNAHREKYADRSPYGRYRAHIATVYYISRPPLSQNPQSAPVEVQTRFSKMKQASKKTQKLLICEMTFIKANKMRGAQTLWNINHFIGGYNLFWTRGTYLLNKGKKTPFRKIVILEKLLLCEMSSSTVKWEEVPRLFETFIILLVDTICFRRKGHIC